MNFRGEIEPNVRVGTSILIVKDGKVLVGRRKGSHAEGLLSFPGGHLEFGETWTQCIDREVSEECGSNLKFSLVFYEKTRLEFFVTNDIMPQYHKHYLTLFFVAEWVSGEPENAEPEKCEGWQWYSFDELKQACTRNETAQWIPFGLISLYRHKIGI